MTQQPLGALDWGLLALRFLVELVLFLAPVVIGARTLGGAGGVALGIAVSAVLVTVWGVLLSPRRKVDAPLRVRVVVEALIVVGVAAGLALADLGTLALALVVVEVVIVAWLWARGMPPGSDAGAPS